MRKQRIRIIQQIVGRLVFSLAVIAVLLLPGTSRSDASPAPAPKQAIPARPGAIFRFPVVPGATISGYFDHSAQSGIVTHSTGQRNNPGAGYYFQCSSPAMYDWVGCSDGVTGEGSCPNERELWYDGHKGTDYEFAADWHTGAFCNPGRFSGITYPIYAPARGKVLFAGYDDNRPANGWHIRLKHDLNNNGNFDDDNFRSVYLHFTANALAVTANQVVEEGQYLGLGGSTGYSSSPHLHFEVQKSNDGFQSTLWSVDPYGWGGYQGDPWPYKNVSLFQQTEAFYLPLLLNHSGCIDCSTDLIQNGGFESGSSGWNESGIDIVTSTSDNNLPITPYSGNWLAWLGGRNNAVDNLSQSFTVPGGARGGTLYYLLRVDTLETDNGTYDTFRARLRTASGELIADLDYAANNSTNRGNWVERSFDLPMLADRQGQTLQISFEAATDGSNRSDFYLDNVSLVTR